MHQVHVRAIVAYDGTDFHGFQIQASPTAFVGGRHRTMGEPTPMGEPTSMGSQRTVQGVLEHSLTQITGEPIRLKAAGRTDAGVHAVGQVVAFALGWRHPLADLHRAWNAILPGDVGILSLSEARPGFHPRFDAVSRAYRYTIWNCPMRNPLLRRTALWVPQRLDIASMAAALELLVGEHDFATFGTAPRRRRRGVVSPPNGKVHALSEARTVRRVLRATCQQTQPRLPQSWTVGSDPSLHSDGLHGDAGGAHSESCILVACMAMQAACIVHIDIEANAFLYRMVRSIVGTVLQVGRGQASVEQFASRFAAADRGQAGPTAPPHGLCLVAVNYKECQET